MKHTLKHGQWDCGRTCCFVSFRDAFHALGTRLLWYKSALLLLLGPRGYCICCVWYLLFKLLLPSLLYVIYYVDVVFVVVVAVVAFVAVR